jgi:UDP:flavonoid glycosyltransferase YjiC (YdhE family)
MNINSPPLTDGLGQHAGDLESFDGRTRMRVLVLTQPAIGDIFPTVPLAWALRAAGHDVLYAGGGNIGEVAQAGLPFVDAAPGFDFGRIFVEHAREAGAEGQAAVYGDTVDDESVNGTAALFAKVGAPVVDGVVDVAGWWRPDVVVTTELQGAGVLVGSLLQVPVVEVGHMLVVVAAMGDRMRTVMADVYERLGVGADARPPAAAAIQTLPPSLGEGDPDRWLLRYVPYNGSFAEVGSLPAWLVRPPDRSRVCITLGTILPRLGGLAGLAPLMEQIAVLDADFVLALGGVDASVLGTLPANVQVEGWVPLHAMLPSCAAIVHHGGSGTTAAALDAGVPQVVVPHGADQPYNAHLIAKRGLGTSVDIAELDGPTIAGVVGSDVMHQAAIAVQQEVHDMPSPSDVARRIELLAADA